MEQKQGDFSPPQENNKKRNFPSWNFTSQGILEIAGMLHAAHPKCKLADSLCQECIFIFLLCFWSLSLLLLLLLVAVEHSDDTVLKWLSAQWSLYRNCSWPCDSHWAHKAKSRFAPPCPCWVVPSDRQITPSPFALTGQGPADIAVVWLFMCVNANFCTPRVFPPVFHL